MSRRIPAGHQRCVRRQRNRCGRVGVLEADAARRQAVDVRRARARVAIGADAIGAKRVDGDEHEMARAAPARGVVARAPCTRCRSAAAARHDNHHEDLEDREATRIKEFFVVIVNIVTMRGSARDCRPAAHSGTGRAARWPRTCERASGRSRRAIARSAGNSWLARNCRCLRNSAPAWSAGKPRGTRVSRSPVRVPTRLTNALLFVIFLISGHVSTMCSRTLTSCGGLRRVHPAPDPHPARRDFEVQPAPSCLARPFHGNTAAALVLSGVLSSLNRVSR